MGSLVPLLVAVPLLTAAALAAANRIMSRRLTDVIAILVSAGVTAMACAVFSDSLSRSIVYWFGGWLPRSGVAIGISFVVDPFSGALAVFAGVLVTFALIVSWHYFEAVGTLYHVLMLVFLAALTGFVLTGDIFTLFVFFELMSVAAYALTAYKIEESSLEGALNFAVTNTIAGYLLLFGIGLLYGRTGALNLAQMGNSLAGHPVDGLIVVSSVLILCGLFTKGAVVPFHFWLDDAHAVAPTPVCILFSGIMVQSALYAVARIYWTVFSGALGPHIPEMRTVLLAAAVVTSILGGILCLAQRHIKRMLAFSTISHSGLILAGLALFHGKALAGAGVYLLGHGMAKAALFICAGILLHRTSSVDEIELRGKGKHLKWTALFTVIGALGLCGVPPFATFTGKAWIDESAAHHAYHWLPIVLSLTAALTAGTVLRMAGRVFYGLGQSEEGAELQSPTEQESPETYQPHHRTPLVMLVPAGLLLLGCLTISYLPGLKSGTVAWSDIFTNRAAFSNAVLGGVPETAGQAVGVIKPALSSYVYAAASLLIAAIICYVSLSRRGIPHVLRRVWARCADPILDGLRYCHSGYVGDYVVWQVIGVAVVGTALLVATR